MKTNRAAPEPTFVLDEHTLTALIATYLAAHTNVTHLTACSHAQDIVRHTRPTPVIESTKPFTTEPQ